MTTNHNINEYFCEDCKKKFFIINSQDRMFDIQKYYYYCTKCINNHKFYSKTVLLKKFYLQEEMFSHLKILYITNKSNLQKYYLQSDIINVIHTKYDDINTYLVMVNLKKNKQKVKNNKKTQIMEQRKKEIMTHFMNNKLEFNYIGDCYAYINYGKPSIQSILTNEFNKLQEQNERRILLANMLQQYSITLNKTIEDLPLVLNYIRYSQGNIRNIINTIRNMKNIRTSEKNSSQSCTLMQPKSSHNIVISFDE